MVVDEDVVYSYGWMVVWMTGWMWNTGKEEGEVGIGSARAGPEKMHGKKRVGS